MMKKLGSFFKKYKLSILIASLIIVIGVVSLILVLIFTTDKVKLKNFKNDNCTFEYDSTWKIKTNKETNVVLEHKSESKLEIEIINLEDEYKYSDIDEIIDEIIYDISLKNEDFELVSTKEDRITKHKYDGYKLLYENKDSGVMIVIAKTGNKLLLFVYEAKNENFDILLDSVQGIIYNFELIEESFALNYKINLDTSKIEWKDNQNLVSNLKDNKEYEYAKNHYLVNLSIPSNFKEGKIDSSWLYLTYQDLEEGNIYLSSTVNNKNIYEEFGEDRGLKTIFYQYNTYRDGTNGYDFNELVEKMTDGKGFIYKVNYKTKVDLGSLSTEHTHEIVHLVYEIDASHILKIEIEARDQIIPKELIDKIKVNSYTNYSSYVKKDVKDGYLVGALKRYTDYNKDKVEVITLKIPQRFEEDDKTQNMYDTRYYRYNYDIEREFSEYEVEYSTISSFENSLKNINSNYESKKSYGDYKLLTYVSDITVNNKTFKLYEGGYSEIGGALFTDIGRIKYYTNTKVLFYDLGDNNCLTIHIKGSDREISESLIKELTNFDIEIKEY